MAKNRYTLPDQAAHDMQYLILWKVRNQVAVLDSPAVKSALQQIIQERAKAIETTVLTINVEAFYVRITCQAPPTRSGHQLVIEFKSATAALLKERFPDIITRVNHPWTRAYYCQTLGQIDDLKITRFIASKRRP